MSVWAFGGTDAIEEEERAIDAFDHALNELVSLSAPVAKFGDGNCGYIFAVLKARLETAGLYRKPESGRHMARKKVIPKQLRTQVFERDKYRCLRCGAHTNLRADHVVPESKGGRAELNNLQTLCQSCNSWKGTKTIDFRGS